jgi:cytochrome c peroxidase
LIHGDPSYAAAFSTAYPNDSQAPEVEKIKIALAAFVGTLDSGTNALDRYLKSDDSTLLSAAARRGFTLFRGAANCSECHLVNGVRPRLSDGAFHSTLINPALAPAIPEGVVRLQSGGAGNTNAGRLIESDPVVSEMGRYVVTGEPKDIGAFRTPSLRNVARTAPYMHDGRIKTLREAVDREIYYRNLQENRPNSLTEQDRQDLVAFLEALSDVETPRNR